MTGELMSVLLEHDDFKKSRKALITTSVLTIALSYIVLGSNELEIFKLKILVNKETIILAGKISVLYLLFNYAYFFSVRRYDAILKLLERTRQKSEEIGDSRHQMGNWGPDIWVRLRRTFEYLYEFLVPTIVALFAVTDLHYLFLTPFL
jgi:hypothetical protein